MMTSYTFDYHDIDGDECYGSYVQGENYYFFVDLREDKLRARREIFARFLIDRKEMLTASFESFVKEIYGQTGQINTIGIYSKGLPECAEVYFSLADGSDQCCLMAATLEFSKIT